MRPAAEARIRCPMRAHLVQTDIAWENRPENYRRTTDLLASAAIRPGDLVVLPEMFDTGFSFRLEVTADQDGATLAFLQATARRLGVTLQGGRTVIGPDGRGRNQAPIIGPDGAVIDLFDKIHPFSFGKETEFFTGGERVFTYRAGDTTVCPAICYDLRFPEVFRRGLKLGAEVFALGANWPTLRSAHRRALGVARAIENQAYMLCVNRCGQDPNVPYDGASYAVDAKGEVVGTLGDRPGVLSIELDLAGLREWREKFPAWRDGRLG